MSMFVRLSAAAGTFALVVCGCGKTEEAVANKEERRKIVEDYDRHQQELALANQRLGEAVKKQSEASQELRRLQQEGVQTPQNNLKQRGGKPSEADAQKVFSNTLSEFQRLVRFTKTNSREMEAFGVYEVEYEAEVSYLKDCARTPSGEVLPEPPATTNAFTGLANNLALTGSTHFKAGQHEVIRGWLSFEKTERGWKGRDGNLY